MGLKFILFIGHHKVGSTSLQNYLARNAGRLLAQGILYPTVMPPNLKRDFKTKLTQRFGIGPSLLSVREAHNVLAQRMVSEHTGRPVPVWHRDAPSSEVMIARIAAQIAQHRPSTVILCAEAFSNFSIAGVKLVETLAGRFDLGDARILCSLRRPDQYLASWHGQVLKFGRPVAALRGAALDGYLDSIHLQFAAMLEPWRAVFGAGNMLVSNYNSVLRDGGSVEHFWRQSGLQEPPGMRAVGRDNASIAPCAMEIVRRANGVLSEPNRQVFWRWMVDRHAQFGAPPNGQIEVFGAVNRARLVDHFEPINRGLGIYGDGTPFFGDLDAARACKPVSDLEAAFDILPRVRETAGAAKLPSEILAFLGQLDLASDP